MSRTKKTYLRTEYFIGIGVLIARKTGYTEEYVRNVLNGKYGDRDTKATREIRAVAEKMKKGVKN